MKIMMIPSEYYPECCGGVEVMTQVIAEGLVKRGQDVVVLCASDKRQSYMHNGVRIIKFEPINLKIGSKRAKNWINRMLQIYNPFHIPLFCSIIREEKPDVMHLHMARLLSMSIIKAAQSCGVPVVSTLHEYFSLWNFDPFHKMEDVNNSDPQFYVEYLRNIHRKITEGVEWVTSPMEKTFLIYQKEGYYRNCRYTYINNALAPLENNKINLAYRRMRMQRTPHKFLLLSRLMPFKGIERTLEMFAKNPMLDNWELHIAGKGPLQTQVENLCKEKNNVFYHGYVIDDIKEALFQSCDILWFLTEELETYGLVVAEAFQHAMPVLVSDVTAMRKIVTNDSNGIIIKEFTKQNINSALDKFSDKEYYHRLIENICTIDWDAPYRKMLSDYEDIYKKVTTHE